MINMDKKWSKLGLVVSSVFIIGYFLSIFLLRDNILRQSYEFVDGIAFVLSAFFIPPFGVVFIAAAIIYYLVSTFERTIKHILISKGEYRSELPPIRSIILSSVLVLLIVFIYLGGTEMLYQLLH